MGAFAARVMMVNESIISLGGASSRSVSKLSRDGGLTHGDLPQILCAFVSWLFKIRVQPAFALLPFPPSSARQAGAAGNLFRGVGGAVLHPLEDGQLNLEAGGDLLEFVRLRQLHLRQVFLGGFKVRR
jgi:hypothetical protein